MVNVEVLRSELQYVTDNPAAHDQGTWLETSETSPCGTAGCLFGNAVFRAGLAYQMTCPGGTYWSADHVDGFRGAGADLFGLTMGQAHVLSSGGNSLYELWVIASIITDGAIEIPEHVSGNFFDDTENGIRERLREAESYRP